ncbi:MAG: hypothetical protein PHE84_01840 [bacterium]|nr:hypothetical protein [bacterium]
MSEKETQLATKYTLIKMTDPENSYANIEYPPLRITDFEDDFPFILYIDPIWNSGLTLPSNGIVDPCINNGKPCLLTFNKNKRKFNCKNRIIINQYKNKIIIGINLLFPIRTIKEELSISISELKRYRISKGIDYPAIKILNKKLLAAKEIKNDGWPKFFALIELDLRKYSINEITNLARSIRDERVAKGELTRIKKERFLKFQKYICVYDLKIKYGKSFKQIENILYEKSIPKTNLAILQEILKEYETTEFKKRTLKDFMKLMSDSSNDYLVPANIAKGLQLRGINQKEVNTIVEKYKEEVGKENIRKEERKIKHHRTVEQEFKKARDWIDNNGWKSL